MNDNAIKLRWGLVPNRNDPVFGQGVGTWQELAKKVTAHAVDPNKGGAGWLPADIAPGPRNGDRAGPWCVLVLDIEAPTVDTLDGKVLTAPYAPSLPDVAETMRLFGMAGALATSHSHEAPTKDGTLGPRYRITLPVSRSIGVHEIEPLAFSVAESLGLREWLDTNSLDAARLFYFPRVPAERQHLADRAIIDGEPLDVDRYLSSQGPAHASVQRVASADSSLSAVRAALTDLELSDLRSATMYLAGKGYGDAYGEWQGVGAALRSESRGGREPELKALWLDYSRALVSYKNDDEVLRKWERVGGDKSGKGAVFSKATELGWSNPANGRKQPGDTTAWPDPVPLPDALPTVRAFDPELLPEALRGWVADIAHRMQCPPDFTAVGALVTLSSLIGARAVVAPKERDDWRVVPNLWGVIVGKPGVMKSPALAQVMNPLHRLEARERELWRAAHAAWELDFKVAELAADASKSKAKGLASKDPAKARALLEPVDTPAEPLARRYVVNDATVEKLADMLTVNEWGLLVYRDEIHGLLCSMDRQGQEGARGFYLTGYDGNQGHAVDRIGRGESYVPRVCLAMLGGIQPGKLQSYVREAVAGGAGDDGLLQRFALAVWPDVSREFAYVDRWPDTPAKQAAWAVFERLNDLQPASDTEPQEWRFSPEAQTLFVEWLEPFETEIRGDDLHPALVSHLSKYRKLIPALALIFALVDTPDSGGVIHERELIRALAWGDYLRSHAERIYAAAVIPETTGAKLLLDKIKAGKLCDSDGVILESFTPRLVAVKNWTGLGTTDTVRKVADLLNDYGWLAREAIPTGAAGGRPTERYLIHPALLKWGAA